MQPTNEQQQPTINTELYDHFRTLLLECLAIRSSALEHFLHVEIDKAKWLTFTEQIEKARDFYVTQ